jgi:flagellar basal-body rod protein FlgC
MISLLTGINSTGAALDAERIHMDVISQNIANINTTRGVDGKPYQRQQVVFETVLKQQQGLSGPGDDAPSVQVARIEKDSRPPRLVYNPTHPDANAQGMVAMPDIDINEEMVDMIASSRTYEANLAVVKNAQHMAAAALSIGKH